MKVAPIARITWTLIRFNHLINMQKLVTLLCVATLAGCTGAYGKMDLRKPVSLNLTPPPGPPEYEQGWSDGCESGMNAYANPFYKTLKVFEYRQDPELRHNKMYYQVWKDAYFYCAVLFEGVNTNKL